MTQHTLGILGGGQLGMFSALAAQKLGFKTLIFVDTEDSCAGNVADDTIVAPYDDENSLKHFADICDFITYEFENIPTDTVRFLNDVKPVFPDDRLLDISQDRVDEKSFLNSIGLQTTKWSQIEGVQCIIDYFEVTKNQSFILKTRRFGYDGKGQFKIDKPDQAEEAWDTLNAQPLIAESFVDFKDEASVIVARDASGHTVHYGPMLNNHKNHILHETFYPSGLSDDICERAIRMTIKLAEKINLCGVLCLELFVCGNGNLLANEIAPRAHNSGHWTIDGCDYSQFDNHVRAICGLDVMNPNPKPSRMLNLIGDDILKLETFNNDPHAVIHNYGKKTVKDGRKMGHVNFV